MNRLDAMQTFVRIAELSSFSRAADALRIPKASASTAIQQLEGALGTRLLHRTTRKVQLTLDGGAFYERCKDVLADLDELETMFQRGPHTLRGRLRVDMPGGAARDFVIPRLPEFLRAHPQLEVELSSTDRRVDLVREGFDCVLRAGALGDTTLVARPLGRLALINVASPDYLERHGVPRTLDDLATHALIHYAPALGVKPAGWECVADGATVHRAMSGALTVNNADAYRAACLAGIGLIQAPAVGLRPLIDAGRLVEVMRDFRPASMPVSLLYAHRRNLSKRVHVFMNWITDILDSYVERPAGPHDV